MVLPFHIVIPARMASSRLPGKPLALLDDRTVIEHVWRRASEAGAQSVVVATDDERIAQCVRGFGGDLEMTRANHQSGTDRVAEVARARGWDDALIVNVQGDEPFIPVSAIQQVVGLLAEKRAGDIATLSVPFESTDQWRDPNCVKVVADCHGHAMLFSRAAIPYPRQSAAPVAQRHIGIYGYRSHALQEMVSTVPCALEIAESLEQLRAMWLGMKIVVAEAQEVPPPGIDTEDDLAAARATLRAAKA
ncbi:MAG: 3-deoxy-manno-octulosonate cytidylyltransferase [Woeseiaceae bacterium]